MPNSIYVLLRSLKFMVAKYIIIVRIALTILVIYISLTISRNINSYLSSSVQRFSLLLQCLRPTHKKHKTRPYNPLPTLIHVFGHFIYFPKPTHSMPKGALNLPQIKFTQLNDHQNLNPRMPLLPLSAAIVGVHEEPPHHP